MIKKARKALKMSQFEAAIKIGVCLLTYQLWERGVGKPSPANKIKLEEVLGIKIEVK